MDENTILQQNLRISDYSPNNNPNSLIQTKKRKIEKNTEENPKVRKLNSKQKKRLKNFMERKTKEAKRAQVFRSLAEKSLTEDQMKLLHSSRTLGQKESAKQKLRRQLNEKRAGIANQENDIQLEVPVEIKTQDNLPLLPPEIDIIHIANTEQVKKKKHKKSSEQRSEERREKRIFFNKQYSELDEDEIQKEKLRTETIEEKQRQEKGKRLEDEKSKQLLMQQEQVGQRELSKGTLKKELEDETKVKIKTEKHKFQPEEEKVSQMGSPQETKAFFVSVDRDAKVQGDRMQLPIIMEEYTIMEAIKQHNVVIICGETGSGKTTQVPQFLYEGGFGTQGSDYPGLIGVTEPRRVAAISMAKRVSFELNMEFGKQIGYQIRYDSATVGPETLIKFMTDGILLKEIQNDFLLSKYSAIIIDEAHERSLNTDILIGLLSRIVPIRAQISLENAESVDKPKLSALKLIIMSATLRVEDFVNNATLFPVPPPVISIDSRQYPVKVHFNKKTPTDHIDEAFKKVCKIHKMLPAGGILVFLTGQQEIELLCRRLREKYPISSQLKIQKEEEDSKVDDIFDEENVEGVNGLYVLPLYSVLPTNQQMKVFEPPPVGSRLVVVATNVAETSLTIPGIKYVVDAGKAKELHHDKVTGISQFVVDWTSKASANQRAGRAGRTGPGHCYRLYSSAVFNNYFKEFSVPEINLIPVEGIILQMKSMGIENILSFPFPTPLEKESLATSIRTLVYLGALDKDKQAITPLGKTLAAFPLTPRYAKMLVVGKQGGCFPYVMTLVAALSVKDPLLRENLVDSQTTSVILDTELPEFERKQRVSMNRIHQIWANSYSDLLATLKAIGAFEFAGASESFCEQKCLHFKSMKEIHSLRLQLANIIRSIDPEITDIDLNGQMVPPHEQQEILLRQIITAGLIDRVARRENDNSYSILHSDERVFIHPTSFLFSSLPEFCVYKEIIYTSKPYMKGVTAIEPSWLSKLGVPLARFSNPLDSPPPR